MKQSLLTTTMAVAFVTLMSAPPARANIAFTIDNTTGLVLAPPGAVHTRLAVLDCSADYCHQPRCFRRQPRRLRVEPCSRDFQCREPFGVSNGDDGRRAC